MSTNTFDFAVIGLGAVGAAAFWQLSKSNKSVVGFDQFSPPHNLGSSHGETRITRVAVGEGMDFVPLVKRSHEIWREIEAQTGIAIMRTTGGLLFESKNNNWSKHGSEGFFERTVKFAQQAEIPYEVWDAKELQKRHPEFNHEQIEKVYYEPGAGYLNPELAVQTQIDLAQKNGATVKTHYKILNIQPIAGGGVGITTNQGYYEAGRVILSAGAWIKDFIPQYMKPQFKVCRQVLYWVRLDEKKQYQNTPVFMWGFGPGAEDFLYGFPSLDGSTIKVASENFKESHHPDTIDRKVSEEEIQYFLEEKVGDKLLGLKKEVLKTAVCQYTVTEDANFVIDEMPDFPEVLIASACSGHGFKHSAAIGEALAKKLLGEKVGVGLVSFGINMRGEREM
jgi:monomeric sarcosine oxidase